jgi:uracil-DNA glycosylase
VFAEDSPPFSIPAVPLRGQRSTNPGDCPTMNKQLPPSWQDALAQQFHEPYFERLERFVDAERKAHAVYPPEDEVFRALELTPLDKVKVVLLGQDPYHGEGQAHGLCFSVRPGVKAPPSLVNIFKELKTDLGCTPANNGCLLPWAQRGVLLLNAVLTVRAREANSHEGQGWEQFTDAVLRAVNDRQQPAVFALWGRYAQKKGALVDVKRHRVVRAAHPSPLSAAKFCGSRVFTAMNSALEELGQAPIDWQLPDISLTP